MNELTKDTIYTTDRLTIRRLRMDDLAIFHEMQHDPEVMQYVDGKVLNLEENRGNLMELIERYNTKDNEFWVWAIEHLSRGMVGTIALVKDEEDNWEIGYRLARRYWGLGIASEAVMGFIEFCETNSNIQNLVAYADRRNIASQRVLSKSGFVNLGIKYSDDSKTEDYIYSISTI